METKINETLGEVSALFMSQECKGTEIVMPTEELSVIADKLEKEFNLACDKRVEEERKRFVEGINNLKFIPTKDEAITVIKALTKEDNK